MGLYAVTVSLFKIKNSVHIKNICAEKKTTDNLFTRRCSRLPYIQRNGRFVKSRNA